MPESVLNEVTAGLADILSIDAITFGQFVENNFVEDEIGFLRAALKEDGYARTDLQKKFKIWLDTVQDAPEQSATEDVEVEMESADALQTEIDAKLAHIKELLPPAIESVGDAGFQTWVSGILDEECKGIPIDQLSRLDLDIIIGAMEARIDKDVDDAADNGKLF